MRPRVRSRVPQLPPAQNEELADRKRERERERRRAQERRAIPRRERPRDSISHPCSCDHFDL